VKILDLLKVGKSLAEVGWLVGKINHASTVFKIKNMEKDLVLVTILMCTTLIFVIVM
jgi:hypothetical protein